MGTFLATVDLAHLGVWWAVALSFWHVYRLYLADTRMGVTDRGKLIRDLLPAAFAAVAGAAGATGNVTIQTVVAELGIILTGCTGVPLSPVEASAAASLAKAVQAGHDVSCK